MMAAGNRPEFFSFSFQPWGLLMASGSVVSTLSILSLFGSSWWVLDLFSHFRVQSFLGLLILSLLLLFARRLKGSAVFGLFALINFCTIAPFYFGKTARPPNVSRSYRALLMNVNTQTGSPEKVGAAIQQLDADIVVLEEVDNAWRSSLAVSLQGYPYSKAIPRADNFGIAIYSKHALLRSEIHQVSEEDVPSIIAELELPDGRLTVIATHPLPPGSAENSRLRDEQLAQFPAIIKRAASPVLLLGDLNATPWSAPFKRLLRDSGLRDSSQGQGILPTWPAYLPILLIPIDHCLHTPDIHIINKARGPQVGSDRYPLLIDFVFALPPPQGVNNHR